VELVLIFSFGLILAVLISDLASRSILSTAVLFLAIGFLAGPGVAGWIHPDVTAPGIAKFIEITLFIVLFTDGMQISKRDLREGWQLAARTLLIGMPLTIVATALLARWLTELDWTESFLVAAALSPTDPIFAAAIIGREEVSLRVRRLLNVESGFNDGLALPAVMVLLGTAGQSSSGFGEILQELVLGIAIGLVVPWAVNAALQSRFFAAAGVYEKLAAISIGLFVFALSSIVRANEFLAAFVAGISISIRNEDMRKSFHDFGDTVAELLKLTAVFFFASILSPQLFASVSWAGYAFVIAVILIVRPVALAPALAGSNLRRRECVAIAWFGPKGFASLLFGFMILNAGLQRSQQMFTVIGLVVLTSMVAHSSTDVLVARSFGPSVPEKRANAA